MNILAVLMGLFAGGCSTIQGGATAQLTKSWAKHPLLSSALTFATGTLLLFLAIAVFGIPVPALNGATHWWHWTGGFLGAYFVFSLTYLSSKIGASMIVALVLAGQILAALVLDHFGLVGYPVRPISFMRVVGVVFLTAGVLQILRSK